MTEFADGKDAGALRTIGEVSTALGIKPHVLRYWEDQFPTLRPLKRAGGRRLYRPEDVALIERIDGLLSREGYTLKGAKAALGGKPGGSGTASSAPTSPEPGSIPHAAAAHGDLVGRLRSIREDLEQALAL